MPIPLYNTGGPQAKSPDLNKLKEEILKNLSNSLGPKIQDIPNIYEQQPVPRLEPEGVYPIGVNQAAIESLASALPTTPAAPVPQQYAGDKQLILDIMRGNIPPELAIARENKLTPVAKEQRDRTSREFVQKKGEQGSAANKRTEALISVLAQLGVPLGAAIAGSVNPNFLPQAAGLAGGYVGGYQNQQEIARKQAAEQAKNSETRDVYVLDDTGALQKVGNVPATSIVRNPPQQDIFGSLLKSGAVGQGFGQRPQAPRQDAAEEAKEKIKDVKIKSREDAIRFLEANEKEVSEKNINRVLEQGK